MVKKKITAAITVSLSALLMAAGAEASRISDIQASLADTSEIHILYNDRMVRYEDVKPINNEDRIMIPFRAALENMGAEVGYDDSQRLVSAVKGDITISFTLMDDTIYINNSGEYSTMTMDVPMIIVSDRTLVPIRFMSEAFGMQVGWDGDTQTVLIVDYDSYASELREAAPNFARVSDMRTDKYNQNTLEFGLGIYQYDAQDEVYFETSGSSENVKSGGTVRADANVSLVTDHLTLAETPVNAYVKGSELYLKADVITEIIQEVNSKDGTKFTSATGSWYKLDLDKFMAGCGMDEGTQSMITGILSADGITALPAILENGMTTEGDAVFDEVLNLAERMDMIEFMDGYVEFDTEDDGALLVTIFMQPKDFIEMLDTIYGMNITQEDTQSILQVMSYTFEMFFEFGGNEENSGVNLYLSTNDESDGSTIDFWFEKNSTVYDGVPSVSLPASSIDITDFAVYLAKTKV